MKKKQIAQLGVALGLVGAIGVGGTLALMTQTSNDVVNTFTVGNALVKGDITLDEAKMQGATDSDGDGVWDVPRVVTEGTSADYEFEKGSDNNRVQKNNYQDIQPGDDIYKDPTVHIEAETAECYVFINVKGINNLSSKGITVDSSKNYLETSSGNYIWLPLKTGETTPGNDGIYYLADTVGQPLKVNTDEGKKDYMIFESLNAGTAEQMYDENGTAKITNLDNITVTACAVQAKGTTFEGAKAALPEAFTGVSASTVTGEE